MEPLYEPEPEQWVSSAKLWGTRGSVPVSGPQYAHFGGNTSCLEIRQPDHLVIIDAGTGIRELGEELLEKEYRELHLFIGHAHWDHIIGFPFFKPLYEPDFTVHVYGPTSEGQHMEEALKRILQPHHFPIRLEQLRCRLNFHSFEAGDSVTVGKIKVSVAPCDHPGATLGFRIDLPEVSLGYVTDNEFLKGYLQHPKAITRDHPLVQPCSELVDLLHGVSFLIHEAQYLPKEYRERIGWGHSSIPNATALVKLCKVRNWTVTHHDPAADDDHLRDRLALHLQVLEECDYECSVRMAFDGLAFPLKPYGR